MAVGYRSIFSLRHGQDAVRLTAEQFRSWLALKGYGFVAVAPGVHEVAEHAQLVVTELHPHDGSRSLRYRLTESSSAGEWVTTVTVHSDGREDDWIWVDVNAPPSTPGPAASPERLVKDVDVAGADAGQSRVLRAEDFVIRHEGSAHDSNQIQHVVGHDRQIFDLLLTSLARYRRSASPGAAAPLWSRHLAQMFLCLR